MPLRKPVKYFQPFWKEWDRNAQKEGQRNTVYFVNGDQYTGEWKDNKKSGKGTYTWKKKGAIYDGDWLDDVRNGYGTYSLPSPAGGYRKVYSGGWKDDKRQGYGTNFYKENEYFEGEWYQGKRSGWGRMYYEDGSVYEGEWLQGYRHGNGMLRLANENRYEGEWKDDKKHGDGKFYFLDSGQLYIGTWVNDIPKCGTCEEFGKETATNPSPYVLPECTLVNAKEVLEEARKTAFEGQ